MVKFRKGFYADVRVEDRFSTNVQFLNNQLRECKETKVKKAFLRVYDGKMWFYASTSDLEHLQEELDKLYDNATPNKDIDENPIVKLFEVNKDRLVRFDKNCVKGVKLGEKLEMLKGAMGKIKSKYQKILTAMYVDRYSMYEFWSSKGADIKYDYQSSLTRFSLSLVDGDKNFDHSLQNVKMDYQAVVNAKVDYDMFVKEGEDFLLNAKPCEAGTFPIIMSPEVAGVFAHESFGHKSEADFMVGDEKAKKEWAIGKKVGSEVLSIYDTGSLDGTGYVPYDDEGTKCKKTYLIKDGILSGRLHSATTAAQLGEGLTGNARALNGDFEPIVRMTCTMIGAKGNLSFDDLVAKIKHGYYIKGYKHGSGMSTFTIAPTLAYEIVDGKLGAPVKISVITGNVFETLGLIDGVTKEEIVISSGGGCGKMEQGPLNVSDGGPYVSVSKMTVQ